jgi:predicted ATP-binding protein involved in virulence
VGTNGVGKSSILEALAVSLAPVVKLTNRLRASASFTEEDIRVGANVLTIECELSIGNEGYSYLIHMPRETAVALEGSAGQPRQQTIDTPARSEFLGKAPRLATPNTPGGMPFALYFVTRRAAPVDRAPSIAAAAGGVRAALAEAFMTRSLRLAEFADWIRARSALEAEGAFVGAALASLNHALGRFLPGYSNLRLAGDASSILMIDHGESAIPVRKLSDGERGALALVLDLTRRLVLANPQMRDPAAEAQGVVLIDEIELHLHPKWQREIAHNLTSAFPKCQFIATTHSPQVIGEVEHDRIQIFANGMVYSPTHSFGVDSSRVLEEIMDASSREPGIEALHSQISNSIGIPDVEQARELLRRLAGRMELGESDPDVTRLRTLIDFMEGNE